ncbi:unnamed protein product [Toxocara canis]|uniref:Chromodomain-helicase-DNA-binding protein 6-9 tri-helical domain-containing protein n=1 Tax=Toxocara canis TaxID=6265 RepID=A0A183VFI9_TOXCA|nr:unnamed protein product [Toxocara canis]
MQLSRWSKREEIEFMRVLRSYGVKDDPSTIICWTRFRQLSPLLEKKSDSELMEQLYCVLSMCTKQLGNEMSTVDLQRAMKGNSNEAKLIRFAERVFEAMGSFYFFYSDEERSTPLQARIKRGRKKGSLSNGTAMRDLVDAEKEKMRALVHQSFLQRLEQLPLAAAAAMAQGAFLLPQLLTASGSPSSQQQAAMLSSLFGVPSVSTATSTSTTSVVKAPHISGEHSSTEDVLNLSTKRSMSASSLERLQPSTSNAVASVSATPQPASALINTLNFSELLALANLPPGKLCVD